MNYVNHFLRSNFQSTGYEKEVHDY